MQGSGNRISLAMIPRRGRNHTTAVFLLTQARGLETGSAYFEGARALHIFCFQIDVCAGEIAQSARGCKRRVMKARLKQFICLPDIGGGYLGAGLAVFKS